MSILNSYAKLADSSFLPYTQEVEVTPVNRITHKFTFAQYGRKLHKADDKIEFYFKFELKL